MQGMKSYIKETWLKFRLTAGRNVHIADIFYSKIGKIAVHTNANCLIKNTYLTYVLFYGE